MEYCASAGREQSHGRAPMVLAMLLAMLLAGIPGTSLGTPRDDEVRIDFLHVHHGSVVAPFGFRVFNAALLQREELCAREGCADGRDESHLSLERERACMDVAVLCLVDNEMFQVFVLRSANSALPVSEGQVQYDQHIIKSMHFAEGSSDPVGYVDAHGLAPGEYTIALKLVRSDAVGYAVGAKFDPATNKPVTELLYYEERVQLLGVDSEVYSLRIRSSGGMSWALEGLMEATRTAALWSNAHHARSAALDARAVRDKRWAVDSVPDEVSAALGELPVMVFNLRNRPDKRRHMLSLTAALGLQQAEIVEGILSEEIDQHMDWLVEKGWVDPEFLDSDKPRSRQFVTTDVQRLLRYHLSNFVMHLQGLSRGLETGRPVFALFEDDLLPSNANLTEMRLRLHQALTQLSSASSSASSASSSSASSPVSSPAASSTDNKAYESSRRERGNLGLDGESPNAQVMCVCVCVCVCVRVCVCVCVCVMFLSDVHGQ